MSWYYAGPEAKPVGPITLEELQSLRANGTLSPETYVIESTGQPDQLRVWKRYREFFPVSVALPPPAPALPYIPPTLPPTPPISPPPHPLFPSAVGATGSSKVFTTSAGPDPFYTTRKTNGWCTWGFGLGLSGLFFSFFCGIGFFLALPGLFISFVGAYQVQKHRDQSGQGLAIGGLLLSCIALFISLIFIVSMALPFMKTYEQTITEQSTNDSE